MFIDRRLTRALCAGLALAFGREACAAPRLAPLFTDHAVIQRGREIRVSGTAQPREEVVVLLAGKQGTTRADENGYWTAALPPMDAGGPYRLDVRAASGSTKADDVMLGDVWLCSGQSNMEFPLRRTLNGENELQGARDAQLRIMTIAQATSLVPLANFKEAPAWKAASPETMADFSAACYFMARDLRTTQKIAIGAINASWGGTRIRPWMDEAAARRSGNEEDAKLLVSFRSDPAVAARRFAEEWGAWWRKSSGDKPGQEPWMDSSRLDWRPFPKIGFWEEWGQPEFADFNGYSWARIRFELTAAEAAKASTLSLGIIDDLDQTWVNGVGVGTSFGWSNARNYQLARGVLRPGVNEVVVNIGDSWGFGGFQGPAERLRLIFADGQHKPLGEGWEYSVVAQPAGNPPRAPWDTHAGLGTINNAMIAPLGPISLKGVAWYQGESDVGLPRYDRRLSALIASWRVRFRNPELPFLVVALAGFGKPSSAPAASGWAQLIDEQRRAASSDAKAALVVATDLGETDDIHPANKQEVGRRLALAARSVAYGEQDVRAGPMPISARRVRGGIEIAFSEPLRTLSGNRPTAIELCGDGQATCRFVDAVVVSHRVVITDDGRPATRVRHAWSDYPILNLYGGDLPAPPFELPID